MLHSERIGTLLLTSANVGVLASWHTRTHTERIKQLEEEKSKIEAEMAHASQEVARLKSELERRPPLDFNPAKTKVRTRYKELHTSAHEGSSFWSLRRFCEGCSGF